MLRAAAATLLVTVGLAGGCASRPAEVRTPAAEAAVREEPAAPAPAPVRPPDLLVPPGLCGTPATGKVTRAQALQDLELARHILARGYAGYDVLAGRGVKWEQIFASARGRIEAGPEQITAETLRAILLEAMGDVPDGHLALFTIGEDGRWRWKSPGKHRDAWTVGIQFTRRDGRFISVRTPLLEAGYELLSCKGHPDLSALLRPTLNDRAEVRWRPVALSKEGSPANLGCRLRAGDGGRERGMLLGWQMVWPAAAQEAARKRKPIFQFRRGKVPWIRLGKFDSRQARVMSQFVASAGLARGAKIAVVDMRGNPGGDDTHARHWFMALTNIGFQYTTINELISEATRQGDINWVTCTLASGRLDDEGRRRFEQKLARYRARYEKERQGGPFRRWSRRPFADKGRAKEPWTGTLVVLTDRACASSCETFLMYARQLPNVIVVGENSAGVGEIGETREYRLPHSGVWVQAGTKWFQAPIAGVAALEGTGFMPDLWLAGPEWEGRVGKLVACLEDAKCGGALQGALKK